MDFPKGLWENHLIFPNKNGIINIENEMKKWSEKPWLNIVIMN